MSVTFRAAGRGDVAEIIALFSDDILGRGREAAGDLHIYLTAFDKIAMEPHNKVIVGEGAGARIVATYQLTFITGLSLSATRRAQIEGVRVATDLRGQGIGAAMIADAETRARSAGCTLLQLTMNTSRTDAHRFYEREGFVASHTGFKKPLE